MFNTFIFELKSIKERELKKKIFSQQCENAQHDFDNAYVHAKDALTRLEYVSADDFFLAAEKVDEENRDCDINKGTLAEEHTRIIAPATYLKMMRKMNSAQQNGNYHEAQSTYEEAGNYFANNNVSSFTISHEPFYDYLQHKANNASISKNGICSGQAGIFSRSHLTVLSKMKRA